MNKLVACFALTVVLLSVQHLSAQKIAEEQLPAAVRERFQQKFAAAKPKWEKNDEGNFEAAFKQNKKKMNAIFNSDGKCVEVRTKIPANELPAEVNMYISAHYQGFELQIAEKIERGSLITYHVVLENETSHRLTDSTFDYKGALLEEVFKEEK